MVLHATTVATNAVLERKGAQTGLITTEGFRDVLIIGRQKRYETYDLYIDKPKPLVQRRHIAEVIERVAPDGAVVTPLDESVDRAIDAMLKTGARRSRSRCCMPTPVPSTSGASASGSPRARPHLGVHIVGRLAEVPRVRAHQHDRHQRLRQAAWSIATCTISKRR